MEGHLLSHEDWEVLNARRNTDMFGSEAGKCLLAKHEDPLTIQYSSRGWAQWHASTIPALGGGGAETGRSLGLTRQSTQRNLVRPSLKNLTGEQLRQTYNVSLWPPHTHIHTCICIYTHMYAQTPVMHSQVLEAFKSKRPENTVAVKLGDV